MQAKHCYVLQKSLLQYFAISFANRFMTYVHPGVRLEILHQYVPHGNDVAQ